MKIAAYNIWDHPAGLPHRTTHIIDILTALDADILCLQENFLGENLSSRLSALPYCVHHPDTDLSVLSRYPITSCRQLSCALLAHIRTDTAALCLVNVHLPWQSASAREQAIVDAVSAADEYRADYTVIAGDFNCSDASSVHRFLCGEQSLCGHDASCFDLAEAYAALTGIPPEPTLDFRQNPRWGIIDPQNTLEKNQRFDRILLVNPYPAPAPTLLSFGLFGREVSEITHLAPSDHWGIYACLEFPELSSETRKSKKFF